jgi:type IV secretion system protein VirD4
MGVFTQGACEREACLGHGTGNWRGKLSRFGVFLVATCLGMAGATQFVASVFHHQRALGAPLWAHGGQAIYPPWAVVSWARTWGADYRRPFAVAGLFVLGGIGFGVVGVVAIARAQERFDTRVAPHGVSAWANFDDVAEAGLFAAQGVILGSFHEEVLCYDGPGHQLLVGATRSGKGRSHVIPTLLAWPESALVLDIKSELAFGDARLGFPGTAGFRETLGPVLCFAPTQAHSCAFNPLFEVRRGVDEVRDVQNIVEIIVDPAGDGRPQDFWDRSAKAVLVGVILHVLYAEPLARKNFAVVREKLRDLDATANLMRSTLHRINPVTGKPEVHPEVLHAAESYLAGEDRLKSGVKATAESFFGIFADPLVAEKTAKSDFRIADLMAFDRPVTVYLQPPPSDAQRLMGLMRLVINQIGRGLMEDQVHA